MDNKPHFPGKILLTTDFSEASVAAFPYAEYFAAQEGAELEIVTVAAEPALSFAVFESPPSLEDLERLRNHVLTEAQTKLAELAKKHFTKRPPKTCSAVTIGAPGDFIVEKAARDGYGLVIIASHGHGVLAKIALGSTTERIMGSSPCPVLVVPCSEEGTTGTAKHLPLRHILVTTDFSVASEKAFDAASDLAKLSGAQVTIGHVIENPLPGELLDIKNAEIAAQALELVKRYRQSVERRLRELALRINSPKVETIIVDKTHSVPNSFTEFARERGIDLIVIASRGAGSKPILIGGVTERIARHAPCPVLVVPPGKQISTPLST